MDIKTLQNKINSYPRTPLACLPTPLEPISNFAKLFGRDNIYIKRDDQTGLAFGGNKARKLEFIMADALAKNADVIITWGGVQSNWCRQVAAAAKKLGIKARLVLFKKPQFPDEADGNYFLDKLFAANINVYETDAQTKTFLYKDIRYIINAIAEEEKAAGHTPYIVPVGGSLLEGDLEKPLGAISYVNAFLELFEQAQNSNITIDKLIVATGSGSTHAGLLVGAKAISPETQIIALTVGDDKATMAQYAKTLAEATIQELDLNIKITDEDIIIFDEFGGEGYGVINSQTVAAIECLALTEGILTDPVYTGKALYGLIRLLKQNYFAKDDNIVFLHTGGTPALFAYKNQIMAYLT